MNNLSFCDYLSMQTRISKFAGLYRLYSSAEVTIYGDDGLKQSMRFYYSDEDEPIIKKCHDLFFIKTYDIDGRPGINTQTSKNVDFRYLGYGHNSTIVIRHLIALNYLNISLDYLLMKKVEVGLCNENHFDLRRSNIILIDRSNAINTYELKDMNCASIAV